MKVYMIKFIQALILERLFMFSVICFSVIALNGSGLPIHVAALTD